MQHYGSATHEERPGLHALWESVYMKMESEPEDMDSAAAAAARQRGKQKEDKVCGVCGDRALGYNFDAISCESCKAFFRRNAPKGLDYFKCPYDERCKMDVPNRRFCKRCRLKKCFDIGMRKEYILTEEERMKKRQKIEENRKQREAEKMNVTGGANGGSSYGGSVREHSSDSMSSGSESAGCTGRGSPLPSSFGQLVGHPSTVYTPQQHHLQASPFQQQQQQLPQYLQGSYLPQQQQQQLLMQQQQQQQQYLAPQYTLTPEEVALIDELIRSYRSSLDICVDMLQPRDQSKTALPDLVNVAEVSIRRVIDMSKKIRCFKQLPQPTQITLLKGGSIELLIIRSVLTYDKDKQLFLDARDNPITSSMTLDELRSAAAKASSAAAAAAAAASSTPAAAAALQAGGGIAAMQGFSLIEDMMRFVRTLAFELCADETMLILLLVISLFSPDRPNLDLKDVVAREQERYSLLLLHYLESKYAPSVARAMYPKLLMKLTDIRNLNEESSQVFLNMNADTVQPLMKEVLDLHSAAAAAAAVATTTGGGSSNGGVAAAAAAAAASTTPLRVSASS